MAAVCPITVSQVQRQKPWYIRVSTHQEPDHLFLKTVYYSRLLLENTHAMAHRPRSQTDRQKKKEERKQGEKRQQYIKCFSFNETNPKDVQSGSRCAVHKHGKTNKQKDRVPTQEANPRPGWTCHQGGFSWTALGPEPLGWAQERRAPASLPSAPGWLGNLCPHFHVYHLLP